VKYEIIKNPSDKKVKKKWLFQMITWNHWLVLKLHY
jgi:hypothetical protein